MRLDGYGEDRLVAGLIAGLGKGDRTLVTGAGDDCAVVRMPGCAEDLLLKTDAVVEGIHFEPDASPGLIGRKALCRAISDIAAMGGKPRHALITLAVPGDRTVAWVRGLYAGIRRAGRQFGVSVAGGETTRSPGPVFLSVALTGTVPRGRAVLRSGGRAGDVLAVTGRLGGSLRGWHLRFQPRVREGMWLAGRREVHAMMDLSDGLSADLPRLARAGGVDFALDVEKVPRRAGIGIEAAMGDGEDYELLLAVAPRQWEKLAADWRREFPKLPLTCIGRLIPGKCPDTETGGGFHHF